MSIKVDINVCYYGKPYHTIAAIRSLVRHSRVHINKIFITIEKKQPKNDEFGIYILKKALRKDNIHYIYPTYFYNLGDIDVERARLDAAYRYQLPYQYVLENSTQEFVFIMHNDCLFHGDMIGKMISTIQQSKKLVAGIGPIGQCWNCPASFEKRCDPTEFMNFQASSAELISLMDRHPIPRKEITLRLLQEGKTHPLPECRLNEYAALLNTRLYRSNSLPRGSNIAFAGNWGGNDWGTVWFYEMVNRGFHFIHQPLEEFATHAPFNEINNGISAYSNERLYQLSERRAKEYCERHFSMDFKPTIQLQFLILFAKTRNWLKRTIIHLLYSRKK